MYLRDGVNGDLVSLAVGLLDRGVVGILVRYEEGGFDVAAVGVLAFATEHLFVEFDVVVVDGIIEGDGDHLGYVSGRQVSGNGGAIFRAEAVGKYADGRIARWRTIRIVVDICKIVRIDQLSLLSNSTRAQCTQSRGKFSQFCVKI